MPKDDDERLVNNQSKNRPRMGVMLRQSLGAKSANGSTELAELKIRYQRLCTRLKGIQKALKERHAALLATAQSRVSVAQSLALMGQDTPLSKVTGDVQDDDGGNNNSNNGGDTSSYAYTMTEVMDRNSRKHADDFHTFAMDYVDKWEKTVTTRVNADMKQTEKLRLDADHYQAKVDNLQDAVKKLQDKNKPVPEAKADQLERNEKKLQEASNAYNDAAQDLFMLMEEVVDRSWRDLHPLLQKSMQWDVNVCKDEAEAMEGFGGLTNELVDLAREEKIRPRLKDMVDGTPELLSTRPDGVKGFTFDDIPEQAPSKTRRPSLGPDED